MRSIAVATVFFVLSSLVIVVGVASAEDTYTVPPAKNLTNRISVGYNKQLNFGFIGENAALADNFFTIDSLSTKYWATDRIGLEGMVGYFTAKYEEVGGWGLDLAGKFIYNLIMEDYMSFYTGAGLGIIPVHIDYGDREENETGFELMAYAGFEFFFEELPNLGFDVEFGLRYIDIDEYQQFSTYGGGFGTFGIRYYF